MVLLKAIIKTGLGLFFYTFFPKKKIILILSTMRSGSTLLKALLAEAPEIEHLNERAFDVKGNKYIQYFWFYRQSKKTMIVIKKPASYDNSNSYPKLPKLNHLRLVLIRHPHAILNSLIKMNKEKNDEKESEYLINYIYHVFLNLTKFKKDHFSFIVHYEDLIENPKSVTLKLFKFIGSKKNQGVQEYSLPKSGMWKWGIDDGGEKISSLKVQFKTKYKKYENLNIDFGEKQFLLQKIYHLL